jgi:hypothetical protein
MKLVWNGNGDRLFETGVDRGVLYPRTGPGVAWNGLISVSEDSEGGSVEQLYFDGIKYLDIVGAEDFKAQLEAYAAPPEFAPCDGSKALSPGLFATQQPRQTFGLSYRTLIGNDLLGQDYGYKLHIVYGCTAAPSQRASQTIAGQPTPSSRTWSITTVPPPANTFKPTAHFVVDSTKVDAGMLGDLESFLYGRAGVEPRLPSQTEIVAIFANRITEPLGALI